MRTALSIVGIALLLGCPEPEPEPEPPTPEPVVLPVTDLVISGVTVNQSVEIPLVDADGRVEELAGPVIAGRAALLRVYVETDFLWIDREVRAELVLEQAGGATEAFEEIEDIDGDSEPGDLDTTFDFELPAESVTVGARWSVAITEVEPGQPDEDDDAGEPALWPTEGTAPLEVTDWGGALRVHLLPLRYDADGSGREPDVSPEQIALLERWLFTLYPVRELELTVLDVMPTEVVFNPDGEGMGDVLSELRDLRGELGVPWDTYLFAMVTPRETFAQFCNTGCTAGLAYRVGNINNAALRVGIGLGYPGEETAEVMAHELGHNHDRAHAPCGTDGGVDNAYPHDGGSIGVWGWDAETGDLVDPEEHADLMGYCRPRWVSDHNWSAFHRRAVAVEGLRDDFGLRAPAEPWLSVVVKPSGLRSLGVRDRRFEPEGELRAVRLLDARGRVLDVVDGWLVPFDHLDGGSLMVPAPAPEVCAIQVEGRTLTLP